MNKRINEKDLLSAFTNVGDDLIEESAVKNTQRPVRYKKIRFIGNAGLSASLCLMALIVVFSSLALSSGIEKVPIQSDGSANTGNVCEDLTKVPQEESGTSSRPCDTGIAAPEQNKQTFVPPESDTIIKPGSTTEDVSTTEPGKTTEPDATKPVLTDDEAKTEVPPGSGVIVADEDTYNNTDKKSENGAFYKTAAIILSALLLLLLLFYPFSVVRDEASGTTVYKSLLCKLGKNGKNTELTFLPFIKRGKK